jgi:hypothetical protein
VSLFLPSDALPLLLNVRDQVVAVEMPENYLGSVGKFASVTEQEIMGALSQKG